MTGVLPADPSPHMILTALDQRLTQVAHLVLPSSDEPGGGEPGCAAAQLLPQLVSRAVADGDAVVWLLLTAVFGAYPTSDQGRGPSAIHAPSVRPATNSMPM